MNAPRLNPKAVVFDLDGTLTRPYLDFAKIRREIGVPDDMMILDYLDALDGETYVEARAKVDAWEADGAEASTLNDGVTELLALLRSRGIPTAVVTRNTRRSVERVCAKHGIRFDAIVAADDDLPVKPSPEPVRHVARELGVDPRETLMVGDYVFDVACGRAAGATTVFVTNGLAPEDDPGADIVVDSMRELVTLLT